MDSFRVLIIHNPTSGRAGSRLLVRVLDRLAGAGVACDLQATAQRGDAEAMARDACGNDYAVIVAAGGDGTIGEVVNGLGSGAPPLAIIPLGTANVLAGEIGLSRRAAQIAATIKGGRARDIFMGRANGRRFLVMAGAGLDAEVVQGVSSKLKKFLGKSSYLIETMKKMFLYDYPILTVSGDGREDRVITAVACKGRRYGGPHVFAPDADLARPDFELVQFRRGGPLRVMLYGLALVLGMLRFMPGVERRIVGSVDISGPSGAPVQGDGDIIASLPVRLDIDPEPLTVLYPPDER